MAASAPIVSQWNDSPDHGSLLGRAPMLLKHIHNTCAILEAGREMKTWIGDFRLESTLILPANIPELRGRPPRINGGRKCFSDPIPWTLRSVGCTAQRRGLSESARCSYLLCSFSDGRRARSAYPAAAGTSVSVLRRAAISRRTRHRFATPFWRAWSLSMRSTISRIQVRRDRFAISFVWNRESSRLSIASLTRSST